jgi:uncharacterized spore protein YtfJ
MGMAKDMMKTWQDTYSVQRVFGEPVEKGDIVVIPVAQVAGGGGGGTAPDEDAGGAESSGSGFGGMARPAGVYVVRADGVEWQPALDITRLGIAGIALAALIALTLGWALGRKR